MPKPRLTQSVHALGFAPTLVASAEDGWRAYKLPGGTRAHSAPRGASYVGGGFSATWMEELPTEFGEAADGNVVVTRPQGLELRVYRVESDGVMLMGTLTPAAHALVEVSGNLLLTTVRPRLTIYDTTSELTELTTLDDIVLASTDGHRVAYLETDGAMGIMARTAQGDWQHDVVAADAFVDGSRSWVRAMHVAGGHVFVSFCPHGAPGLVVQYSQTADGWERKRSFSSPKSEPNFGSTLTGKGQLLGVGGDNRMLVFLVGEEEPTLLKTLVQKVGLGLDLAYGDASFHHRLKESVVSYEVQAAKKKRAVPTPVVARRLPPTTGSVEGELEPFLAQLRKRQNLRDGLYSLGDPWSRDAATVEEEWTPRIAAEVADWSLEQRTGGVGELQAVATAGMLPNWFALLRGLNLSDSNRLTAEPLMKLAEWGCEPHLEVLNLVNVPVSAKLLKTFDKTGYLASLKTLDLGGRKRSDALVRALVGMSLPALETLHFGIYAQLSPSAKALLAASPAMRTVSIDSGH